MVPMDTPLCSRAGNGQSISNDGSSVMVVIAANSEFSSMNERTVFFLSDQTGVTAETLGHSLLTQFDGRDFRHVTVPFIDSDDKALEASMMRLAKTRSNRWYFPRSCNPNFARF